MNFGIRLFNDAGDFKNLKAGQIVTVRKLRDENSMLKPPGTQGCGGKERNPCNCKSKYCKRYHKGCIKDEQLYERRLLPGRDYKGFERG